MWFITLKKAGFCLTICFAVWLLADCFVAVRAYSGYLAAFMGVCWLLAAWLQYLKSKGTDYFKGFRRKETEVPYYLRREKTAKTRLGLFGNRHAFDDDLNENADLSSAEVSDHVRRKTNAIAFLITGIALLLWSQAAGSILH